MKKGLFAIGASLGWILLFLVLQTAAAVLIPDSVSIAAICSDGLLIFLGAGWLLLRKQPILLPFSAGAGVSAFLLGLALMPLLLIALTLLPFPEQWLISYEESSSHLMNEPPLLLFFLSVLVAPAAEELLIRGLVYSTLRNAFPKGWTMFLSSAMFGALHGSLLWALYAFVFGLLLAWVLERSGSLGPCILMHMAFNLGNFLPEGLFSPFGFAICTTAAVLAAFWFKHCTKIRKSTLTEPTISTKMSL